MNLNFTKKEHPAAGFTSTDLTGNATFQPFFHVGPDDSNTTKPGKLFVEPFTIRQLFSYPHMIEFTESDYSTPIEEVYPGKKFWIKARGENLCSGAKDQLLVRLRVPTKDSTAFRHMVVVLNETSDDTGLFQSDRKGIVVEDDPGKSIAHISAFEMHSSKGFAEYTPRAEVVYKRKNQKATSILFDISDHPFYPKVAYQAIYKEAIYLPGLSGAPRQVTKYYDPKGKLRTETESNKYKSATISRFDLGVTWITTAKDHGTQEHIIPDKERPENLIVLEKEEIGQETVNGIPATKFRIKTKSGTRETEGEYWFSKDGVVVKAKTKTELRDGNVSEYNIEVTKLVVGEQPPELFERESLK
jgi:hypothetical protein